MISEPTRGRALLDPILAAADCTAFDSGIIDNPPDIANHKATYLIPHDYSTSSYKRVVWLYIKGHFEEFNANLSSYN